jgi:hypothetical protein
MKTVLFTIFVAAISSLPAMADEPLDACKLLEHPEQYQSKLVRVRGSMHYGSTCPGGGILWVEGDIGETFIGPYDPAPSSVTMTIVGTFRWQPGTDTPYALEARTFESVIPPARHR